MLYRHTFQLHHLYPNFLLLFFKQPRWMNTILYCHDTKCCRAWLEPLIRVTPGCMLRKRTHFVANKYAGYTVWPFIPLLCPCPPLWFSDSAQCPVTLWPPVAADTAVRPWLPGRWSGRISYRGLSEICMVRQLWPVCVCVCVCAWCIQQCVEWEWMGWAGGRL